MCDFVWHWFTAWPTTGPHTHIIRGNWCKCTKLHQPPVYKFWQQSQRLKQLPSIVRLWQNLAFHAATYMNVSMRATPYLQGWMTADIGLTSSHGLQTFFSSSFGMKEMWTGLRPVLVTTSLCSWGIMKRTFWNWNCKGESGGRRDEGRERERERSRNHQHKGQLPQVFCKTTHFCFVEVNLR